MSAAGASLDAFFAALPRFVEGDLDARAVEARLGPCPEGTARLARYAVFVHRQRRAVVDGFFASAKAASDHDDPARWPRLADAFVRERPPRTWDPNAWATELPAFLDDLRARGEVVPDGIVELVDYAVVRYAASIGDGIVVRRYEHDVAGFVRRFGERPARPAPLERAAAIVLVGRSRVTERVVVLTPSLATLLALARRADPRATLPGALAEADVAAADADLVARGLLAPAEQSRG